MNLLDIAQTNGRTYKRASSINGGEYHGQCPACGGTDRFHVWPAQGDYGTFWCRGCDLGGDAIEYLMKIEGLTFPAAAKAVGKDLPEQEEYQSPKFKRPAADRFIPREITAPADLWVEHAVKFADWSHQQLLALGEAAGSPLAYLAGRGITKETAIKHRLGWNPGEKGNDLYKAREAWGLETVMHCEKKKKLWLPIGLVIPFYVSGTLRRVRIRIPNERRTQQFDLSYYLVPGSAMDTFIINPAARAFVITEAELDAILIDQFAGDLVGSMGMGNSTAKPTTEAFGLLSGCLHIANALDYDARLGAAGQYENPGGVGWLWWKKHFAQAERWPVPVGKDPGDAWKQGVDLREWIKIGLPPVLTLPVAAVQDYSARVASASIEGATPPLSPPDRIEYLAHTTKTGRRIYITESAAIRDRMRQPGQAWFLHSELQALKGLPPEEIEGAITARERIIDVMEVFGGEISAVNSTGTVPK